LTAIGSNTLPRLRLLGEVALFRDGAFIALPPSKKTRALLVYLAATAKQHRRERLCTLFWDIPDDPRGALRWSLSRLRPLLDSDGFPRIQADRENVALAVDSLAIDLHIVERLLAKMDSSTEDLIAAASLFEGEFAEGLDLNNCSDFQVWLTTQRESARRLHLRLLQVIIDRLPPDDALNYAQRRLVIEPDVTSHHAEVLALLLAIGRRREAETQAELSIRRLQEVDPRDGEVLAAHWRKLLQAQTERPELELPGVGHATAQVEHSEERKQVSILHANLRDASLSDDPEAAAERLAPLLVLLTAAIKRYGGTVTQRRSDGVTALFGAPISC
jgi:DNA-binding SARP family transcriptional activator